MLDIINNALHRELAVQALSATAVCCAVLMVSWPYMPRDRLEARMRRVAGEREVLRLRERARLAAPNPVSALRRPPKKLYSDIVAWLGLGKALANPALTRMLQVAGFRGNAAAVTYLAARILAPFGAFAVALFYVFLVVDLQQPAPVKVMIALVAGGLGYFLPAVYVKNQAIKRQQTIERAWPDALDLLLICVESGMSIEPALQKVADEIGSQSVPLSEELNLTTAELAFLPERRQAYENLAERTGLDGVKAVMASLKQAEKHGTSVGRSLRVLAQENRNMRMSKAEKKAAALPPKLTVPMIVFFLPVLFVVIITPAIIQIVSL